MEDENVEVRPEQKDEQLDNSKMTITIDLERIFDPKRTKNNLMMTMECCNFTDDDDKDMGSILHGVPAHTVIRDKETKEDWVLNYGELFRLYKKAREHFGVAEKIRGAKDIPNSSDLVV